MSVQTTYTNRWAHAAGVWMWLLCAVELGPKWILKFPPANTWALFYLTPRLSPPSLQLCEFGGGSHTRLTLNMCDLEQSRAAGSKNAALYRTIDPKTATQWIRFALYKSMEVKPVEENPEFVADAEEVIGKAKGVILACAEGCDPARSCDSYKSQPLVKYLVRPSRSLICPYFKRRIHLISRF